MTEINFASLRGDKAQKLETLHFLRINASNRINRLRKQGKIFSLPKAEAQLEGILYEIEKLSA